MVSKRVSEAEKDDGMVTCILEAAETLARLARGCAVCDEEWVPTGYTSQDQAIAVQQFCGNTSTVVTGVLETNETVSIVPSQPCSTSYPSNPTSKSRQHLTEAQKEERRIRRVLANRESARQTIRRRRATYLEFSKKAANLTKENENLKKEKELAVEEYNCLKDRNTFLKQQISKLKKAKSKEVQEEPKSTSGGRVSSATMSAPFLPYNHPVLVPFLWPPVVPSSNVLHQGREMCSLNGGSGNPVFVLPVPWLIPCLSHWNAHQSHSGTNCRPNETVSPHQHNVSLSLDYHQSSSNQNTGMDASNSAKVVPPQSGDQYISHHRRQRTSLDLNLRPGRHTPAVDMSYLNNASAPKHLFQGSSKNQETVFCHHKEAEDVIAATSARRKRKELMRLKNICSHPNSDWHSMDG